MQVLAINCTIRNLSFESSLLNQYTTTGNIITDVDKVYVCSEDVLLLSIDSSKANIDYCLELVLRLRLKNNHLPVFIIGWLSLTQLLKINKKAAIIGTLSTYYVQLPSTISADSIALLLKSKSGQSLETLYRNLFDAVLFRHSEANWWSVKLLIDVYNGLSGSTFNYPDVINEKLHNINNKLAQQIYHFDEIDWQNGILEYQTSRLSKEEIEYQEKIDNLESKLVQSNNLYNFFRSQKDQSTADAKKAEMENIKQEIHEIQSQKSKVASEEKDIPFISNLDKNILIIDDKVHAGWLDVYKLLFPKAAITTIEPDISYKTNVPGLYKEVVAKNIPRKDIIILDLRLFDEKEPNIPSEELSGVQLLKFIRENYIDIPILITSASNKSVVLKTVLQHGADAYWLKQGIDEEKSVADTIQNYFNLIDYLEKLTCNEEYALLKQLFAVYKTCSSAPNLWWINMTWMNDSKTFVSKNILLDYLLQIINMYRFYLQNKIQADLPYSFDSKHFLAGIINKIGGIVEMIHGYHLDKYITINNEVKNERFDTLGVEILSLRNKVSHYNTLNVDIMDLKEIVDRLEKYLTKEQCFQEIIISDYSIQCGENKFIFKDNITQIEYSFSVRKNGTRYFDEVVKIYRDVQSNRPIKIKINNEYDGLVVFDEPTLPEVIFDVEPDNKRMEIALSTSSFYFYKVVVINGKVYKLSQKASDRLFENNQTELVFDADNCQWIIPKI